MLPSKNKECTEAYAAVTYINVLGERIRLDWDEIHKGLKDLSEGKLIIKNKRQATDAFFKANIAIGMQAVKNIFSTEQTERLNGWVMYLLDEESRTKVMKYNEIYEKAIKDMEEPVGAVLGVLLCCWFGEDAKRLEGLRLRFQSLIRYLTEVSVRYGSYWTMVKEECKLARADLPLQ